MSMQLTEYIVVRNADGTLSAFESPSNDSAEWDRPSVVGGARAPSAARAVEMWHEAVSD